MPAFVAPALATTANDPVAAVRVERAAKRLGGEPAALVVRARRGRRRPSRGRRRPRSNAPCRTRRTASGTGDRRAVRRAAWRAVTSAERFPAEPPETKTPPAPAGIPARSASQRSASVLGPDRPGAVDPPRRDRRRGAHDQVEEHRRLRRGARDEREGRGVVGRDRRRREHLGPDPERLLPADTLGGDRVARARRRAPRARPCGRAAAGSRCGSAHTRRSPSRAPRCPRCIGASAACADPFRKRTRPARRPAPRLDTPRRRYFTSSWQNSPNAST